MNAAQALRVLDRQTGGEPVRHRPYTPAERAAIVRAAERLVDVQWAADGSASEWLAGLLAVVEP